MSSSTNSASSSHSPTYPRVCGFSPTNAETRTLPANHGNSKVYPVKESSISTIFSLGQVSIERSNRSPETSYPIKATSSSSSSFLAVSSPTSENPNDFKVSGAEAGYVKKAPSKKHFTSPQADPFDGFPVLLDESCLIDTNIREMDSPREEA